MSVLVVGNFFNGRFNVVDIFAPILQAQDGILYGYFHPVELPVVLGEDAPTAWYGFGYEFDHLAHTIISAFDEETLGLFWRFGTAGISIKQIPNINGIMDGEIET